VSHTYPHALPSDLSLHLFKFDIIWDKADFLRKRLSLVLELER